MGGLQGDLVLLGGVLAIRVQSLVIRCGEFRDAGRLDCSNRNGDRGSDRSGCSGSSRGSIILCSGKGCVHRVEGVAHSTEALLCRNRSRGSDCRSRGLRSSMHRIEGVAHSTEGHFVQICRSNTSSVFDFLRANTWAAHKSTFITGWRRALTKKEPNIIWPVSI